MTNAIPEIRDTDLMFVTGSNTTEAHPVIAMEMKKALHRGARLIVADPRKTDIARRADLFLQLRPGTDVWLLNAMAHVIVDEGLWDAEYVTGHVDGFEAVAEAVAAYPPEAAEEITGVPAEDIRTAARWYATTRKAGIYYTLGITEHTTGTDNVQALANLVLMTGHLGQRSAGLNPLRGQNNVQGANDSGATPLYLPGYQRVDDAEAHARFAEAWGAEFPTEPGLNLNQIMDAVPEGKIKALYVMGEDPLVSEADCTRLEDGVGGLEFLVVQDLFLNETGKRADVVLPAGSFAEKEGTFTNSDRRVQRVREAVDAPGDAKPDWEILVAVTEACGYALPDYGGPAGIWAEMAALTPKFRGISHERIDREGGLQWPVPEPDSPSTAYLHEGRPMRGRALMSPVAWRAPAEGVDSSFPLVLSTGRLLFHYNAGVMSLREPGLCIKEPDAFIEVHPDDAAELRVGEGDIVSVTTRRGSVRTCARVTARVRPGHVWMPYHWPAVRTNRLTTAAGDPVTQTAEYKVCAVRVERVSPQERRTSAYPSSSPQLG